MKVLHDHGQHGLHGVDVEEGEEADDPDDGPRDLRAVSDEELSQGGDCHVEILLAMRIAEATGHLRAQDS